MAMGRAMGPEQPDPQTTGPSRTSRPPETVPEEVRKLWDLLPRRERQRRRRNFFRAHPACCSRPVHSDTLASLNARVRILEEALAEFLHATAASIPVPPTYSAKKRDREGAELPSAPTPANIVSESLPDIPPAAEAARNAASPSPITSDFTSAANPCDLHGAALHVPDSSDVTSDVTPANIGPPVTPVSRGRTSSGDTPYGAAPHEAASHGSIFCHDPNISFRLCPYPSDTVTDRHTDIRSSPAQPSAPPHPTR